MNNTELGMMDKAKKAVMDYFNSSLDATCIADTLTIDDVYIVWFCKTLQNFKALLSTTKPDGMYYEFTYDGDKKQGYLDCYKKWKNITFKDDAYRGIRA